MSLVLVQTANIPLRIRTRGGSHFGAGLHRTWQLAGTLDCPIILTFVLMVTKLLLCTVKREFPRTWLMDHFRLFLEARVWERSKTDVERSNLAICCDDIFKKKKVVRETMIVDVNQSQSFRKSKKS